MTPRTVAVLPTPGQVLDASLARPRGRIRSVERNAGRNRYAGSGRGQLRAHLGLGPRLIRAAGNYVLNLFSCSVVFQGSTVSLPPRAFFACANSRPQKQSSSARAR